MGAIARPQALASTWRPVSERDEAGPFLAVSFSTLRFWAQRARS